jgi:hypothetical protein
LWSSRRNVLARSLNAQVPFFRVAVEGATTDGRAIDRQWLLDAAQTYNRETYAARVNLEHIRGVTADPPFQSLGDVLSLRTQDVQIDVGGKTETRLALFAEIEALEPLVAMNKAKQKLFTSIEINPNFAGTGKAYLVGLAVTDSPASLGTEMLTFAAAQGDKSPLRSRKLSPETLFTVAEEFQLELADDTADPAHGLMAKIAAFFNGPASLRPARRCPPNRRPPRRLPLPRPRLPTRPPRSTRPWPGPSRKWPPASRRSPGPAPNAPPPSKRSWARSPPRSKPPRPWPSPSASVPPAAMAPSAPTAEPACIFPVRFPRIFHAQPDPHPLQQLCQPDRADQRRPRRHCPVHRRPGGPAKLVERIQLSSEFLSSITMQLVAEQEGQKIGIGVTRPISGRTNTAANNRRQPTDPTDTGELDTYRCEKTDFDWAIPYAKLDAWRHRPEFETILRDAILKQQGRDTIMTGWHGTSVARRPTARPTPCSRTSTRAGCTRSAPSPRPAGWPMARSPPMRRRRSMSPRASNCSTRTPTPVRAMPIPPRPTM